MRLLRPVAPGRPPTGLDEMLVHLVDAAGRIPRRSRRTGVTRTPDAPTSTRRPRGYREDPAREMLGGQRDPTDPEEPASERPDRPVAPLQADPRGARGVRRVVAAGDPACARQVWL